jgi:Ankyrin repeats (3 copies)
LRYREALDTIEEINKLGSRSEVLVELEITILSKLIRIYEQQHDSPTVWRFSRRRSTLYHGSTIVPNACHIEHTAQYWSETAGKLPEVLDSIHLQVEAPLHATGTPLFPAPQSALRYGHDDVAKVLCKLDGALQNLDMLKQDPILAAAAVGKLPLLEQLVQNDQSLLRSRDLLQRTALFHTACRGKVETFATLVQGGAKVDDRDEAGQSILGAASAAGNMEVVKWLFTHGGIENPNDHIFGPRSPLHDAARAGHTRVCLLLVEKGAYVDYLVDKLTPAEAARANGFNDLANTLELSLTNPDNQHPFNRSFEDPLPQNLSNQVPLPGLRLSNPYACPDQPPLEELSTNPADQIDDRSSWSSSTRDN